MRNIPSIQILRAVAALSVTICHFNLVGHMLTGHADDPLFFYSFASGVDLFFVISGFVMVYSSDTLFAAKRGPIIFLGRRLARIVPLYWVTTILAIFAMNLPVTWYRLIGSYLFIPYINDHGAIAPLNGVGWSLNFEMFFYALFAVAICFRRAIAVLIVCVLLGCLVIMGQVLNLTAAPLLFWSDPIVLEFALGMIIAVLYEKGLRLPAVLSWVLIVGASVAIWQSSPHMPPSGHRIVLWGLPAALIFMGAVLRTPSNQSNMILSFIRLIGDASYSIYLIHPLMGALVLITWHHGLNHFPILLVLAGAMCATIAAAIASFLLFEKPTTKALQRFWQVAPIVSLVGSQSAIVKMT
jgi:exopolysaccharide production protein ExoZ